MNKQDLTEFSDAELSLLVFNTECLYNMRRNRRRLLEALNDLYIYTSAQLDELEQDLDADEQECSK